MLQYHYAKFSLKIKQNDTRVIVSPSLWLVAGKGTNRDKTPFQNAVKYAFYLDAM